MKRHIVFLSVLALAILTPHMLFAGGGGSTYSMLGIGDRHEVTSIRNIGLGYAGSSIASAQYLNLDAPATWSRLNRVRLEGGLIYQGISTSDGKASRYIANTSFGGVSIGIPISMDNGVVLAAGFIPYSTVDYDTHIGGAGYTSTDTIPYDVHYSGTGSIGAGKFGLSYAPTTFLSLGGSFDYYVGSLTNIRQFEPTNTSLYGAEVTHSTTYKGSGATIGVLFNGFEFLAPALRTFSLGATFSSRVAMSSSSQNFLGFGSTSNTFTAEQDTSAETAGGIVIPLTYTLGASYAAGERLLFAVDYASQKWKNSSQAVSATNLRNSWSIRAGMERVPTREVNAPWVQRVALRFGGEYSATYYNPNGVGINQWLLTAGASMPISFEARLHLALEFGQRGKTGAQLARDTFLRLNASLSVGEIWFVRMEEE